jgi:predicted transcriptional regulator
LPPGLLLLIKKSGKAVARGSRSERDGRWKKGIQLAEKRARATERTGIFKARLEASRHCAHTRNMSTKEIVRDLLQKLPEDVSLHDVAQEIEFVAAVRQGLAESVRGERIPIEEIEAELPTWIIR